jgi:hypothetical protein
MASLKFQLEAQLKVKFSNMMTRTGISSGNYLKAVNGVKYVFEHTFHPSENSISLLVSNLSRNRSFKCRLGGTMWAANRAGAV